MASALQAMASNLVEAERAQRIQENSPGLDLGSEPCLFVKSASGIRWQTWQPERIYGMICCVP